MARLWEDTPDYYNTASLSKPGWATIPGDNDAWRSTVVNTGRRPGTNAIKVGDTRTDLAIDWKSGIQRTLAPGDNKIALAFAICFERATAGTTAFFFIGDASVQHISMVQQADNTLEFYRGRALYAESGGTSLGNSGFAPIVGTFYHFSIEAVIHDTLGSLSFKVNNVEMMNGGAGLTGIDTRNGGTAGWTRFGFGNTWNPKPPLIRFCDVVVNDGTGSDHNTHPGNCTVYVDMPIANGGVRQFVTSSGTDDYSMVNEIPPDDGTTYLQSTANGDRVTLGFPDLPTTEGLVKSVTFRHRLGISEAGAAEAVGVMRKNGVNYDGAVTMSPGTSYAYFDDRRTVDPETGEAFLISDVNAIEGGVKRSS